MADEKPKTNRPADGAKLEVRSYTLATLFHPMIKLERRAGFDFAASLSDVIEPQGVSIEANEWQFAQPHGKSATGGLAVTMTQQSIQFDISFPSHPLEWVEQRCEMVLREFHKKFQPRMALSSTACVSGTLDVDGDARTFLADHVMHLDVARVNMLHRPIHLLGMRFFLPPYTKSSIPEGKKKAKPTTVEWHADVKAESLIENPQKLYLEAEAEWSNPKPWDDSTISEIVGHLATTKTYLEQDVLQFLQKPSQASDADEQEGPDEPHEPEDAE